MDTQENLSENFGSSDTELFDPLSQENLTRSSDDLRSKLIESEERFEKELREAEEKLIAYRSQQPKEVLGELLESPIFFVQTLAKELVRLNTTYMTRTKGLTRTQIGEEVAALNRELWNLIIKVITSPTDVKFNVGMMIVDFAYRAYANDTDCLFKNYNLGIDKWEDTKALGSFMIIASFIAMRYYENGQSANIKVDISKPMQDLNIDLGETYVKRITDFYSKNS